MRDRELEMAVRAVQAGDLCAFRILVERCGAMVRRTSLAVSADDDLADDVAQETFLEAYRCLASLNSPAAFPGWIRVIAGRQARRLANSHRERGVALEQIADLVDPESDPAASIERRDRDHRLRDAVGRLPERLRTVAVLHYLHGDTQPDVAAALGLPPSTVKKRLHDARRRLKEILTMSSEAPASGPEATVGLIRLLQAIEAERVDEVQSILANQPTLAGARLRDRHAEGETLLHRVMPEYRQPESEARLAMASLLLAHGADVAAPGWGLHFSDERPLMAAAHRGHPKMVRLLLSGGADPDFGVPKDWWSGPTCRAIDTAAVHGSPAVVEALIEGGAAHSIAHPILAGLTERLRTMLADDPDSANRPAEGALPLIHAVKWSFHPEILDLLLAAGADPNVNDEAGRSPLHVALRGGAGREAVPKLIEAGAAIDVFAAAGIPDVGRLQSLLAADAGLANVKQGDGATPLAYAAASGDVAPVAALLAAGANPDAATPGSFRYWFADRPLTIAAFNGFEESAHLLLQAGANPSGLPLPKAAYGGFTRIVDDLLAHGANIHSRDDFGRSGLEWAVEMNRPETVELLLARGYDPATRGEGGRTALHMAAACGNIAITRQLLRLRAPRDAADDLGQNARDIAAATSNTEILTLLDS